MTPSALEEHDARLLAILDRDQAEAARRAGAWLVCRPGCSDCCVGPFPITRLDAFRLARGLDALEVADPPRAQAIAARARAALATFRVGFPGDVNRGRLVEDPSSRETFFARHAESVCPALDPGSGRCDLYAHRPVSCRTYGPPVRIGGEELPPCVLCFRGAAAETIERCRIEPDPDGEEERLLALHVGANPDDDWETLVASALVR